LIAAVVWNIFWHNNCLKYTVTGTFRAKKGLISKWHFYFILNLSGRKMKMGIEPSISVEQAVDILNNHTKSPALSETLLLPEALGRIAAFDIVASMDQPPFDRSPLDGYAVNARDILLASKDRPTTLNVTQTIYAGDVPIDPIGFGAAARIMTGAWLPLGANCVVRQEDTDYGAEQVRIFRSLREHENYCRRGEDVTFGQELICRGQRLNSISLGILASQGKKHIKVFTRPKIGILSTGSELIAAGEPLPPGKIYDSNFYTLSMRAREAGAQVGFISNINDNPYLLATALNEALKLCDVIVTSGGVSVGEHDYMPQAGELIGAKTLFHGIAAKPGGSALSLKKDGKLILCLSGNPFAAFATFELLAIPVLRKLSGCSEVLPKRLTATLMDAFNKPSKGRRFLRAYMEGGKVFFSGDGHSSGILSSLSGCNCLIDIPAGTPRLKGGETVEVILF